MKRDPDSDWPKDRAEHEPGKRTRGPRATKRARDRASDEADQPSGGDGDPPEHAQHDTPTSEESTMQMQHPAFADVTVEVEGDEAIQSHVDSGWLRPQTKAAKQLKAEREDAAE